LSRAVSLLFGPPGTGKTTAQLQIVENALKRGVPPNRIAYLAFSRKAADEAAQRAIEKFGFQRDDMPYFRTLHSLAFRQLGLAREEVMGPKDWQALGKSLGLDFAGSYDHLTERPDPFSGRLADRMLFCYGLARARQHSIEEEWERGRWDFPLWAVQGFQKELEAYKRTVGVLDFTDFLDECHEPLAADLFILDEAQDLTPQQWDFARRMGSTASQIYIAGDDDQAIYDWAGADSRQMRLFRGEETVLPISYRLPKTIHALADRLIRTVTDRKEKIWAPRDEEGFVEHVAHWEHVDMSEGTWLVLARHRRALNALEAFVRRNGFVYLREGEWSNKDPAIRAVVLYNRLLKGNPIGLLESRLVASYVAGMEAPLSGSEFYWHDLSWPWGKDRAPVWWDALQGLGVEDAAYIRALLRRGESITKPGRIVLSTIHGAKGGEADFTLIVGGWPRAAREAEARDMAGEVRVRYVAATRSKLGLYICPDVGL
jgi:DNA helicase-2/ATP-dependent DNA helicase PcrA